MAQYITGAVTTTSGSAIVTGVADDNGDFPLWTTYLSPGDEIVIANDNLSYQIASVDSDTQLTLTGNYPTNRTSADYVAFTEFTTWFNLPKISRGDIEWPIMFNRAMQIIDQSLGASSGPIADLEVTNTFTLNRPGSGNAALNLEWIQPTTETTVTIPETNLDADFVLTRTDVGAQTVEDDIVFEGDVEVQGELTANIVDSSITPASITNVNVTVQAGDSGKVIFVTGTATLPDATNLPKGWSVTIMLGPGAVIDSPVGGQIVYWGDGGGNYTFASVNVYETASQYATVTLICDAADFIVTAITGQVAPV